MAFPPSAAIDFATELYIGYFNRAPDPAGLNFWINGYNNDVAFFTANPQLVPAGQTVSSFTLEQLGLGFAQSTETTGLYPFLSTPNVAGAQGFVTSIYANLLNRVPDAGGLDYWTAKLTGGEPAGQVIADFLSIVNQEASTSADFITLSSKVTAGEFYATGAANANLPGTSATEHATLTPLSATSPTTAAQLTAAEAVATAYISTGGGAAQTPAVFTATADSITGSNLALTGVSDPGSVPSLSTIQVFDQVNPGGTNNTVTDTVLSIGPGLSATNLPVLTNVQSFIVTNVAPGPETVTLTGIAPALTTLGIAAGVNSTVFTGVNGALTTNWLMSNITAGTGQTLVVDPNQGLTSGTAANGAATLILNNVASQPSPGNNASVVINNFSGTDGEATLTINSIGSAANELFTITQNVADLATLNIMGSASVTIDSPIFFASTATINAATDTGGLNINVGSSGKVVFTGGTAGTESLTITDASLSTSGTSITGGAGTADTFTDSTLAATVTAPEYAALNAIKGFEILGVSTASTIDDSQITAAFNNDFALSNSVSISNLVNNSTVTVLSSAADVFGTAVGASAVTINVGAATSGGLTDALTTTGFTTVNLTSNGTATNTVNFTNSDNTAFTITGADGLTMTVSPATTTGDAINAASFTGSFTYSDSAHGDTINTGSGTTTILEGATTTTPDTITLLTGHTKVDTIQSNAAVFSSTTPALIEKVANFALNQDLLHNSSFTLAQGTSTDLAGTTNGSGIVVQTTYASAAAFEAAAALAAGTAGHAVAWTDNTNTFVAEFTGAAGHAHVIELVGLTGATAIGTATGAGHILVG
jgi:hypothetical protein